MPDAPNDNLLPLSALQHLLFCPRQCALIHVERLWVDNVLTVKGQLLHRRADRPSKGRRSRGSKPLEPEARGSVPRGSGAGQALTLAVLGTGADGRDSDAASPAGPAAHSPRPDGPARAVPLRCLRLGLWGKADIVEFFPDGTPFPVEYKRGRPKSDDCDRVQLCAQAMCLEEMLARPVPAGALFYGNTRRRLDVPFTPELRATTERAAADLQTLIDEGRTPAPEYAPNKCDRCSLKPLCLPEKLTRPFRASAYLSTALALPPDLRPLTPTPYP